MFYKLFRKYNQNKKTIWVTIIFIAFFVILLHTIFGIMRASRDREMAEMSNAYYANQNNINNSNNNANSSSKNTTNGVSSNQTSEGITVTKSSSPQEVINYFIILCNENKINEAYNMISDDCKTVLFPTIDVFKSNYINKIFTQSRSAKVEKSMYGNDVYKVTYTNNLLASGGYSEGETNQDYIYIKKQDENVKVSLNKFLYIETLNRQAENGNILVRAITKKVYLDREEYQIQISNNTNNTIYATPSTEKVYLLNKANIKYTSNIDELQSKITLVEPNKSSVIDLTFFKGYNAGEESNLIVFSEIITNYTENQNEAERNIISISVNV